jgi:hypothetical protein
MDTDKKTPPCGCRREEAVHLADPQASASSPRRQLRSHLLFSESVFIRVHPWLKQKAKTPPPVWQWGPRNPYDKSEPNRPAGKRAKQQVQIQIAIHDVSLVRQPAGVNSFP